MLALKAYSAICAGADHEVVHEEVAPEEEGGEETKVVEGAEEQQLVSEPAKPVDAPKDAPSMPATNAAAKGQANCGCCVVQ